MDKVSVVINYCSLENRFIDHVIRESKKFSDNVIVVSSNKFLNGEQDNNLKTLDGVYHMIIPFDELNIKENGSRYGHNYFRYMGWKESLKHIHPYILFLDADEVPDGEKVSTFLERYKYENFNGISFDAYWYFREPENRATLTEETTALFAKNILRKEDFFGPHERWSMFNFPRCIRRLQSPFCDGSMFHHYSWVRTKDEMIKKVLSWGHKQDSINWVDLVNKEFEHEFNGTDFVHGYRYERVESFI